MFFFDPHPGFAGAAIRFPQPLLEAANSLDGTKGTIKHAMAVLQEAGDKLVEKKQFVKISVEKSLNYDYIAVEVYEASGMMHSFRAIRYGKKAEPKKEVEPVKTVEVEEVTKEEFVAAAVASGMSEKDAEFQAKISKGLGSHTKIGKRILGVK